MIMGIATGAGVHNLKIKKFPDGLDAEIFKFSALKKHGRIQKQN